MFLFMPWLSVTIFSYFLFAFSSLTDRYLLAGPLPHPKVFAFYTGVTGILAILLIPFGFKIPELQTAVLALGTGAIGVLGVYASYRAVFKSGVSRIVPMVGALFPLFTLGLTFIENPSNIAISPFIAAALLFFVAGTIFLSLRGSLKDFRPSWFDIGNAMLIAFLFALGLTLANSVYKAEGFVNGFMWMRWGGFLAAMAFLVFPEARSVVFVKEKNPASQKKVFLPFLLGKGAGASAFLVQQYVINISTKVQLSFLSALQGVQYAFLLLFVGILAVKKPDLLKEEFRGTNAIWKMVGTVCIIIGFIFFGLR